MSMKSNTKGIYTFLTSLLLLCSLSFKFIRVRLLVENHDINGLVLHVLFVIAFSTGTIFKLNIWLHKAELVSLVNQIMEINTSVLVF